MKTTIEIIEYFQVYILKYILTSNSILRLRLMKKDEELAEARGRILQQDASLTELQGQNSQLSASLERTRAELDAANLEINAATSQYNDMARQLRELNEQLAAQRRSGDETRALLESARGEIAELAESSAEQQLTISQLNEEKAALSREITAYNQQLLALKGEYETVKAQYEELIRPARSARGKYIAQVYYIKDETGDVIRFKQPGDDDFTRLSLAEVEQRLAQLKNEQGDNLYVKIIIPDNSGLTYNEAWEFMRSLLVKYDYYYQ